MINDNIEQTFVLADFLADPKIPHPTILLVGKRFAGKSTASVSIAQMYNAPRWAAWCGTKDTEDYWAEKFESSASVHGPDENGKRALEKLILFQQRKVRYYSKILKKEFPAKYTLGLVFDDVTSKREFRKGQILEDLFSNGRHYKSIIIISCQYIKQLPPAVRLNSDYIFILHNSKATLKILYEEYVENPEEFGMFLDLVRTVTSQVDENGKDMYNALVYKNCVKTNKLDGMFEIHRSIENFDPDKVILGSEGWRAYNKRNYIDSEYETEVKAHKKKQRLARLEVIKQKKAARYAKYGNNINQRVDMDVDYQTDTDSESEYESDDEDEFALEKFRIKGKKSSINIHLQTRKRQACDNELVTSSQCNNNDIKDKYTQNYNNIKSAINTNMDYYKSNNNNNNNNNDNVQSVFNVRDHNNDQSYRRQIYMNKIKMHQQRQRSLYKKYNQNQSSMSQYQRSKPNTSWSLRRNNILNSNFNNDDL
jgi:hypothetical protein